MTAVMRLADAVLQAEVSHSLALLELLTRHQDEQLHQVVVDVGRRWRLDDEDILVTDRLVDLDTCLE